MATVTDKKITVTLRSPKGTEWNIETDKSKLATVKRNAKIWGYAIVKVA